MARNQGRPPYVGSRGNEPYEQPCTLPSRPLKETETEDPDKLHLDV